MTLRTTFFALLTAAAVTLPVVAATGLTGCDSVDAKFDCAMICDRYRDCFDAAYDTSACRSRCEDNAANVNDFADKADACENCLDDRSCTGSFACAGECIGIVP